MATDTKRKNVGVMIDPDNEDMAMLEYRGPELMPDEVNANASESTIWNLSALPCRRLDAVPGNPDWLYVDTWHIVGPLEGDRRRQDLNIRYGPESAINLGELYIGEKGSTIAWDWVCNGRLHPSDGKPRQASWRIEPTPVSTYAIYYAFTEIYSPDERDVWVATGADDYGKLWINDKLQWTSPIDRKPYTALENVQKVTLKKGHNKVLVRLENAGGATAFSLMISTKAPD